ncbi:hypothetical protein BOX15_Mlig024569g1 [Macrostomum lignano]|uniref:DUF4218 domain-containing protein n=1 Tax=Macrostomum lignano TaxID=282301 RepID=A0A267FJI7_9PLAT|nr:hypothetical protein BOX15_Mlig024569g1 [Macrostomum lignano]
MMASRRKVLREVDKYLAGIDFGLDSSDAATGEVAMDLGEDASTDCSCGEFVGMDHLIESVVNNDGLYKLLVDEDFVHDQLFGESYDDSDDDDCEAVDGADEAGTDNGDGTGVGQGCSVISELWKIYLLFCLPQRAVTMILQLLLRLGHDVPANFKQLKKSNMSHSTVGKEAMPGGNFAYLSISKSIPIALKLMSVKLRSETDNFLDLKVNIDGLPLWKSSKTEFWPILIQFSSVGRPVSRVYPVGLYCGVGKPPIEPFLRKLINEIKVLKSVGMMVQNGRVKLGNVAFICDAVARAYFQCIASHTAHRGCGFCRSVGRTLLSRVVYSTVPGEPRTDEDYSALRENNQSSLSPLHEITGLLTGFPLDYQHAAILGITRRIFSWMFSLVKGFRIRGRVTADQLTRLSDLSHSLAKYIPSEFQRRPRRFDTELVNFKATEYRLHLLYLGPFLFKDILSGLYYDHFMLLHFSIYVFCSPRFRHLRDHAAHCIQTFVSQVPVLYGEHAVSYNFHAILHLAECVKQFGELDNFSTFPFEAYLNVLKSRTKKTRFFFEHALSQLQFMQTLSSPSCADLAFRSTAPNNCAMVGTRVLLITSTHDDGSVTGHSLKFSRDLYKYPYPSSTLGIGYYIVRCHATSVTVHPTGKAICIPTENGFVIIPYASNTSP